MSTQSQNVGLVVLLLIRVYYSIYSTTKIHYTRHTYRKACCVSIEICFMHQNTRDILHCASSILTCYAANGISIFIAHTLITSVIGLRFDKR